MITRPDFYLDLTEEGDLRELRSCWSRGTVKDAGGKDYLVVEILPPIIGQKYGLGDKDISRVLLSPRHQGHSLFPITGWPEFVYVARLVDESALASGTVTDDQVELILWGILHRSEADAEAALQARAFSKRGPKRTPEELVQRKLRFVCEQDGPSERQLRDRLVDLFGSTANVERAYLVRVEYDDPNAYNVALCLRTISGDEDRALVSAVGVIFEAIFGAHCQMDIVFLSEQQEREAGAVCRPFFARR